MARYRLRHLAAAPLVALALVVAARPAGAEQRWLSVRLTDGSVVTVTVDVAPGTPVDQIQLPGEFIEELPPPDEEPAPATSHRGPRGHRQHSSGSKRSAAPDAAERRRRAERAQARRDAAAAKRVRRGRPDTSAAPAAPAAPSPSDPTFFDALPGPAPATGVPDFVIRKFRVPVFLLPIYQAAGTQYGIRWEYLAAINEIETDYGRNLNISSAGALGWMQFMPGSWRRYGVDANRDGEKDPYNPVDAIFAAARYLKAAGGPDDMRKAVFAYNHAGWYVDSVVLRARLIAGLPADLVGSLTGLTDGRFPVAARARYAEDRKNDRRMPGVDVFARRGSAVIAVADGVVRRLGKGVVVLEDAYGNRYTYRGLGDIASYYPVSGGQVEPAPAAAPVAAAPRQPVPTEGLAPQRPIVVKRRLFAHPERRPALPNYRNYFVRGLSLQDAKLKRLRKGSRLIAGTVIGHVGDDPLRFEVRPAGRGAPAIDPKPILDGWKLLESTAIYRASGRNVLYGNGDGVSIGQIVLLPKPLLEKRVLSDDRIEIYPGGRSDIRAGAIDRRVLAALEYLAEAGLRPTVSSLRSGHSYLTASGNVSEHTTGTALDIARVNGIPILGHQEPGGIADQAVRRLMLLQGTLEPHQIISLLALGGNTLAMADHDDHIHVGWRPDGGGHRASRRALAVLKPGQWSDLIDRLGQIEQPSVAPQPSRYAIASRRPAGD